MEVFETKENYVNKTITQDVVDEVTELFSIKTLIENDKEDFDKNEPKKTYIYAQHATLVNSIREI